MVDPAESLFEYGQRNSLADKFLIDATKIFYWNESSNSTINCEGLYL